jgi:hypothetical protein
MIFCNNNNNFQQYIQVVVAKFFQSVFSFYIFIWYFLVWLKENTKDWDYKSYFLIFVMF